jgi:hypothetical protein
MRARAVLRRSTFALLPLTSLVFIPLPDVRVEPALIIGSVLAWSRLAIIIEGLVGYEDFAASLCFLPLVLAGVARFSGMEPSSLVSYAAEAFLAIAVLSTVASLVGRRWKWLPRSIVGIVLVLAISLLILRFSPGIVIPGLAILTLYMGYRLNGRHL